MKPNQTKPNRTEPNQIQSMFRRGVSYNFFEESDDCNWNFACERYIFSKVNVGFQVSRAFYNMYKYNESPCSAHTTQINITLNLLNKS